MAFENLFPGLYVLLKGAHQRFGACHGEAHEYLDGHAQPLQADVSVKAADDTMFLEPVNAFGDGRGGQSDAPAQFSP